MKLRLQTLGGFLFLALPFVLLATHAAWATLNTPDSHYNGFRVEGELLSGTLQSFKAPGPEGSVPEAVCLLRVQPYFHFALPEQPPVDLWMQGGAVVHCLEWGENRKGARVQATGYLKAFSLGGGLVTAVKPVDLSVTDQP